jgi:hypothetical protein
VLNVGVVLVCVAGVNAFLEAQSGRRLWVRLAAVLLPLALLAEQVNSMPTHIIGRLGEAHRFERIPPPPKSCSAFFIFNEGPGEVNPLVTQTDAMLLAQQFEIPTLNGYSGWFPKGWNLSQAGDDGGNAAILWARSRGVNRGLCGLDFALGSWFPVDPRTPAGSLALISKSISGLVKNYSFEYRDLSPWRTYLSAQIGVGNARAHAGTYSLMETSGEGGVYQDVTGLQPGHVYSIAAWVTASGDAAAKARIAVFDPGTDVVTFSPAVTPDSVWRRIERSAAVGRGGTLRIHLLRDQGAGVIFWDDVSIDILK